jgi:WS/DGAT/MGAT family acyltransferase
MSERGYDRLSPLDRSFLIYESRDAPMHVAAVLIHEAAPLRARDGRIDLERIQAYVLSRLHVIPRYRQRLAATPLAREPIWVDDEHFNLRYHVRHSRLPAPGSERQLKRTVGRILSQQLDRGKPLWEMWVIEGLAGDRLAIVTKNHHCMIDGVSGAEILSVLLTSEPTATIEPAPPWRPRPAPDVLRLGLDEVAWAAGGPLRAGSALWSLWRGGDGARHPLLDRVRATARLVASGAVGASSATPFNRPVGPHRRVDWLAVDLDRVRAVKRKLGGTVNDVVLATTAGAVGRFLHRQRGLELEGTDFRVMAPVSMRREGESGALGNRVAAWIVPLPVAERDPQARLEAVRATTAELKASQQALGAETFTAVSGWTGPLLVALSARLLRFGAPFHMVVTNVPGPRTPLYLLESRLLAAHPAVPLVGTLAVGIALFSYGDRLSWGFSADWDEVPDLHELVAATERSFEELCRVAGA